MMHWFTRRKPVAQVVPALAPAEKVLTRFETADRAELDALPRRLRRAIIADRKRRVTAALERFVASKEQR